MSMRSISATGRQARWAALALSLAVAVPLSLAVRPAMSSPEDGPPPGWHHGGPHGSGGFPIERMLDAVKATDAQRAQIRQIREQAEADLKPTHESDRALHQQSMQLLGAPTIDANAIESVRAQLAQNHDTTTRRLTQAMIDASRVLTPQQRAQLVERTKRGVEMMERQRRERRELYGSGTQ